MANLFFKNLPVYYVNLKSSTDRNIQMMRQLKKYEIGEYLRIEAVDGISNKILVEKNQHHDRALTSGEIAAVISYVRLLKTFIESKNDFIFMCDDDVDISNAAKLNFNFYKTLEYHNPKKYSLKLSAIDLKYFFEEDFAAPVAKLIKPHFTSYGNATIINKAWATNFIEKNGGASKNEFDIAVAAINNYTKNIFNTPLSVIPSCDAIMFDQHSFVWRILGVFDLKSTMFPEYDKTFVSDPYNNALNKYLKNKGIITINSFIENGVLE